MAMTKTSYALIAVALAAGGTGLYLWWQERQAETPVPAVTTAPAPTEAPPAPAEPGIQYPVEAIAPDQPADPALTPENAEERINHALVALVGESAMPLLRSSDFARRIVATVDNLDRPFASPRLWPVQTTAGRFTVDGSGENVLIGKQNAPRYEAFVQLVESVDTAAAMQLYVKFYPLLQNAYEAQGYPNKYFNDRLVAIVDHLLKTPDIDTPLAVRLTEVKSETKPVRPWVNYQFSDPQFESLSSGQKIMLRVGPDHRKRLKIKLNEIRQHLSGAAKR